MNCLIGVKTHFSVTESILSPKDLISLAEEKGYLSIAVADVHSVSAIPELTQMGGLAKKPVSVVCGCTFRVVENIHWRKADGGKNPFFYMPIYAANERGFQQIMELVTLSYSPERFYIKPQVSLEDVAALYAGGNVVATSGDIFSVFQTPDYGAKLEAILGGNKQNFYTQGIACATLYAGRITQLAETWTLKNRGLMIGSRPSLYREGQSGLRDVYEAVNLNAKIGTAWLSKAPEQYSLIPYETLRWLPCGQKTFNELTIVNGHFESAAAYRWKKFDISLPVMAQDSFRALADLCKLGWSERVTKSVLGYTPDASQLPIYYERLKYELGVIRKMGFSDYFLLVHDIVSWCKQNGIEVGPGRGSCGGSLIAFLVGITDVDPIRFNLIFERFINPERVDLPDVDLDFMSSRRGEVIEYLRKKWGDSRVAGISNYNTQLAAGILRSVAKANGLSEDDYRCSKLMPKEHGQSFTLEEAMTAVPEIEKFATEHSGVWQQACGLQGIFQTYGRHAAGVIVSGVPIRERAVLFTRDDSQAINWDKRTAEEFGLIKLDILGLSTLDILSLVKKIVKERHNVDLDYRQIALNDAKVMDAFGKGETTGVFQYESGGLRHLLKSLASGGPLTFEDITAASALYRPGPMDSGLMDKFVAIRLGDDQPVYPHPNMRPALEETYSVMVYQEQVMQITRDLAGFTMAESDKLRKAMGKKLPEEMAKFREKFAKGAVAHSGIELPVAERLFDQIEKFAGYGFNKSHATAYAMISYWSMWSKVNYPAEFYAAALTILDEEKQQSLTRDALTKGIIVLPPDINCSTDRFEIGQLNGDVVLYSPFQVIKGLSQRSAQAIMKAKTQLGRPFVSKAEFVASVERRACNIRVQEALDKIGAFASVEPTQQPMRHPDRYKDQKILMPGVMVESVRADRKIEVSPYIVAGITDVVNQCQSCNKCSLAGTKHPTPRMGAAPKIMMIVDYPSGKECEQGKMGEGVDPLRDAIKAAGLTMRDVYLTSFIKGQVKGADIVNEMINGCMGYLEREIELLKPPIILTLGSRTARALAPEIKGGWQDLLGKDIYDKQRDSTIIFGLNPMMIYMDKTKQKLLDKAVAQAVSLLD